VVLVVISPDCVEIWEGTFTLILFPVLIILAFMADKGYFSKKGHDQAEEQKLTYEGLTPEEIEEAIEGLRKKYGKDLPDEKLFRILEMELAPKKTRASYKSGVIRNMTGRKPGSVRYAEDESPAIEGKRGSVSL